MPEAIEREAEFRQRYLPKLEAELARVGDTEAMPGITDLLSQLRHRAANTSDLMLGLLTGNYSDAAPLKLAAAGLDREWFTLTAFGNEAASRPELTQLAMEKYQRHTGEPADPRRVIVIGDTPRDVHCARAHDCVSLAVATGKTSLEALTEAGAEIAVPDLADPAPLLSLLDSEPASTEG